MRRQIFPVADDYVSRLLLAAGMFSFAGLFVTAPALLFDDRLFNGVAIWWKPLKFWLAIGVHFVTLALLVQRLSPTARNAWSLRIVAVLAVAAMLLENIYITIQAGRGRASHFNNDTTFEAAMYGAMGLGALLLVLAPFVIGVMIWRSREAIGPGLKAGAVAGLLIGPVLTVVLAGFMSVYGAHFYAAPEGASDAGGVALFGWSTRYADMRPAHFVATHLIQFGPLSGLVAEKLFGKAAPVVAIAVTVSLAAFSVAMFLMAMNGMSPLSFLN